MDLYSKITVANQSCLCKAACAEMRVRIHSMPQLLILVSVPPGLPLFPFPKTPFPISILPSHSRCWQLSTHSWISSADSQVTINMLYDICATLLGQCHPSSSKIAFGSAWFWSVGIRIGLYVSYLENPLQGVQ